MAPTNQARVIAGHASLSVIPRTRFICLQCRLQSSMLAREERLTRNNHSAQRHASSQTQWLRKKIWGTDNPPGQKDPYAKLTPEQQRQEQEEMELERQAMEEQNLEEESEGEDIPDELIDGLQRPGEYVPATTWHGLRSIRRKKWNAMHPYKGFMNPQNLQGRGEIARAIQRALAEVWTLKQAGQPLVLESKPLDLSAEQKRLLAREATFEKGETGEVQLVFADEGLGQIILESVSPRPAEEEAEGVVGKESELLSEEEEVIVEEEGEEEEEALDELSHEEIDAMAEPDSEPPAVQAAEEPSQLETIDPGATAQDAEAEAIEDAIHEDTPETNHDASASHITSQQDPVSGRANDSWRFVPLTDPTIKFAVLKRVLQLTGHRLSDPSIHKITSARTLFGCLVTKEKPKKVVDNLLRLKAVRRANVEVLGRRLSERDREEGLGRWKVVERELGGRGLPVSV